MCAHRYWQVVERRKGPKISFEVIARSLNDGKLVMAVGARPAMPGHMLDDGRDAACKKSFGDRSAHRGDALWPRGESPAADGGVRFRIGDIEYRRTIDRDSYFGQIESHEASDKTRRRGGSGRLKPRLDRSRRGVRAPMWRRHALNPAALLIDQDRRIGAPDTFPERARQRAQLIAIGDIAPEKDQAPRVFTTKERAFLGIEHEIRAAADEGLRHLGPAPQRANSGSPGSLGDKALPTLAFQESAERRGIGFGETNEAQAIDRLAIHNRFVHADG
jgi:hypothetical protein